MARSDSKNLPGVDLSVVIDAPAAKILNAFFQPDALRAWWQVARSFTVGRPLGPYVVHWPITEFSDDMLGRLGGTFWGTIVEITPDKGFFVGNAYWLAPDGEPIGPMAFEVACQPAEPGSGPEGPTRLRVMQRGFEEGPRWRRYYEVIEPGYEHALTVLKSLLDR